MAVKDQQLVLKGGNLQRSHAVQQARLRAYLKVFAGLRLSCGTGGETISPDDSALSLSIESAFSPTGDMGRVASSAFWALSSAESCAALPAEDGPHGVRLEPSGVLLVVPALVVPELIVPELVVPELLGSPGSFRESRGADAVDADDPWRSSMVPSSSTCPALQARQSIIWPSVRYLIDRPV